MQVEPPQNGDYLIAAYVIAAVILLGYCLVLWRKARRVRTGVSGEEA